MLHGDATHQTLVESIHGMSTELNDSLVSWKWEAKEKIPLRGRDYWCQDFQSIALGCSLVQLARFLDFVELINSCIQSYCLEVQTFIENVIVSIGMEKKHVCKSKAGGCI
jgi:hypothetical protein